MILFCKINYITMQNKLYVTDNDDIWHDKRLLEQGSCVSLPTLTRLFSNLNEPIL